MAIQARRWDLRCQAAIAGRCNLRRWCGLLAFPVRPPHRLRAQRLALGDVNPVPLVDVDHGPADRHDEGDDAVDALDALVLRRANVVVSVADEGDVGRHPTEDGVAGVAEGLFADEALELLRWRRELEEALG